MQIQGSLANIMGQVSNEEFFDYMLENCDDIDIYQLKRQSKMVMGAAFDWRIISNTADLITIASFLWLAYSKLILPLKSHIENSTAGLYFQLKTKGKNYEFNLGNNYTVRDVFIKDFENAVNQLSTNESEDNEPEQFEHTIHSPHWQKYELGNSVNKNPQSFIH